jgi:UDP-N-acetylmuramoyl-tripeptide--D-alanyl-D-alanine ligase
VKVLELQDILKAIGGEIISGNEKYKISSVRKRPIGIRPGTIYFHLHKENNIFPRFNQYKMPIVIVSDQIFDTEKLGKNVTLVKVKNIKGSYMDFLHYYRSLFDIPIVCITGTAGKTTTKEMLTYILSRDMKVQSTKRSLNSIARNGKYLLGIDDRTQAAVIEMGLSHPGNITYTGVLFKPQIGIMTNIGIAHIEGCKKFETYFNEKSQMLRVLPPNGTLILNGDDDNIKKIDLSPFKGTVLYFGQREGCHYRFSNIEYCNKGLKFQLNLGGDIYGVEVAGLGHHNVYNALGAIAAAHSLGLAIDVIIERLRRFKHLERHNTMYTGRNGADVIDDTWNSNPTSAYAGLKVLQEKTEGRTAIAILGKLQRLGSQEKAEYLKMGEYIAKSGIDILVTVGTNAELMGKTAIEKGMDPSKVYFTYSAQELEKVVSPLLNKSTIALFKMSLDKMHPSYRKVVKAICKG